VLPWAHAQHAAFSGDGRRPALATRVFDVATATLIASFGSHEDEDGDVYTSVALDAHGDRLASGSIGGRRSKFWCVATGVAEEAIGAALVAFSPDSHLLAGRLGGNGFVIDLAEGRRTPLKEVSGSAFLFAPDGSALVCASRATAFEHGLREGGITPFDSPQDPIDAMAFSGDGRHLLVRSGQALLQWPDRSPQAVLARAKASVHRSLTEDERLRFQLRRPV
jgi:WD40 repeat protein